MKHLWLLTKKKLTTQEIGWFASIVGRKKVNEFFTTLKDKRKNFRRTVKNNYRDMFPRLDESQLEETVLKAITNHITRVKKIKLFIEQQLEDLKKSYSDIKSSYPVFYTLAMQAINPPFLMNRIKDSIAV